MEYNYLSISHHVHNPDLADAVKYNRRYESKEYTGEIDKVFGEITGERDERDWHWLVGFSDGKVGYLTGGCDYTGWDCQSFLNVKIFKDDEPIHVPLFDNTNQSPAKDFQEVIKQLNQARGVYEDQEDKERSLSSSSVG
jgi:hypothetical protein